MVATALKIVSCVSHQADKGIWPKSRFYFIALTLGHFSEKRTFYFLQFTIFARYNLKSVSGKLKKKNHVVFKICFKNERRLVSSFPRSVTLWTCFSHTRSAYEPSFPPTFSGQISLFSFIIF